MRLSIVIPAFNEAHAIGRHLEEMRQFLDRQVFDSEIVVVDDGSRDDTAAVVRAIEAQDRRVRLVALGVNRGKGFAVKTGILAAQGEVRGFTDADASTPVVEILRVLPAFEKGFEIVIGSRAKRSAETAVKAYFHRRLMGRVFNQVLQLMLRLKDAEGRNIEDTQCGFKWFSARAATAIFSRQTIDGFAFDAEVLYLAKRLEIPIVEMPVNWIDYGRSHVNLFADPLKMLGQALSISWRHRTL